MGSGSSKEKALKNIVSKNRNNLSEQDLEEIMMNTQFNEFELNRLHEKFLELDQNERGKLSNRQFLEIDELKYTPFRQRMLYAFPLKTDEEVRAAEELRAETLKIDDYKDLEDMLDKSKNEEVKNSKDDLISNTEEAKRKNNDEDEKKEENSSNGIKEEDEKQSKIDDHSNNQEHEEHPDNKIDSEEFIKKMGTENYIDFIEFCRLLSVFNPRFNLDEKVKFYFRMFDFNQDKKITEDDLDKIKMEELEKKINRQLTDKIMLEADNGQKEYLDYDDLEKVLWATNIEQKCSMTFFMG